MDISPQNRIRGGATLEWAMPQLMISEVARQVGLQLSAIRYYERIGILLSSQRISGQRRYDTTARSVNLPYGPEQLNKCGNKLINLWSPG